MYGACSMSPEKHGFGWDQTLWDKNWEPEPWQGQGDPQNTT